MKLNIYKYTYHIKIVLFLILLSSFFISCERDENSSQQNGRRLTIVYMVAHNNLDYFAINNINQMEEGYNSNLGGDLYVYIDRMNGTLSHPYILKIEHDTTLQIKSKIVYIYPEQNSASASILREVIGDICSLDKDYSSVGLILWSHGSSWLPPGYSISSDRNKIVTENKTRSFGEEDIVVNNKDSVCEMDIKDLANALSGYHFDFLMFDACYMGSIETAYELRHTNDYYISSPTEILSTGFPYQKIVPTLFEKTFNPKNVAKAYYDYYESQNGALKSGAISVINSNKLDEFASFIKSMNENICKKNVGYDISSIADSIQQYDGLSSNILFDFKDFIEKLMDKTDNHTLQSNFNSLWSNVMIQEYHTESIFSSLSLKNCNGVSTYIMNNTTNTNLNGYYKTLSWYKDSGYDKIFSNIN
jgi:hypothetical protein